MMKPILIASAAVITASAAAFAHSGATGVVKERMDQMKAVAASMKAIGGMIKDAVPYDAGVVKVEAAKIANGISDTANATRLTLIVPYRSM